MRFAVIGDIHSNLYALLRVFEDILKKDVDFILCTGDNVGYSPFPNEVIALLKENRVLSIQGNYDKAIGNRELICGCDYTEPKMLELAAQSVEYTNHVITDKNRAYLRNLPGELRLKCGGLSLLLVHGSPRRINEVLHPDSQELSDILESMSEDLLICGHTHKAYVKHINGKHVINAGTVGKPVDGNPGVVYVMVEIVDSNVNAEIIEVEYDFERAARAIEETDGLPDEFAVMLRCGGVIDI